MKGKGKRKEWKINIMENKRKRKMKGMENKWNGKSKKKPKNIT